MLSNLCLEYWTLLENWWLRIFHIYANFWSFQFLKLLIIFDWDLNCYSQTLKLIDYQRVYVPMFSFFIVLQMKSEFCYSLTRSKEFCRSLENVNFVCYVQIRFTTNGNCEAIASTICLQFLKKSLAQVKNYANNFFHIIKYMIVRNHHCFDSALEGPDSFCVAFVPLRECLWNICAITIVSVFFVPLTSLIQWKLDDE